MKHQKMQAIALERIYRLFELAQQESGNHPERSKRYVHIAREISKKTRVRMPDKLKTGFCKKCGAFLKELVNAGIEERGSLKKVKCLECGFERKTGRKPAKE